MHFEGTVFRYGRDVDTDVIIPARYLNSSDHAHLAAHAMEDLDPTFATRVKPGDIIVAEENFGCGSSREHAPVAIKAAGVSCVIAKSFARIFYRNAINVGLAILECPRPWTPSPTARRWLSIPRPAPSPISTPVRRSPPSRSRRSSPRSSRPVAWSSAPRRTWKIGTGTFSHGEGGRMSLDNPFASGPSSINWSCNVMKTYTICCLPGDGIGPEILAEGKKVLEAVGKKFGVAFACEDALIGGAAIDATGYRASR